MEANVAVQASVRRIFSRVLNDSTIANDSLSSEEVYNLAAAKLGIPVSSNGFNRFQETTIEIIAVKIATCPDSKSSLLGVDDVSILVTNLTVDDENIKVVTKNFGKLLCLQSTRNISKIKPQADLVEKFYDSINGDQLATIFGITNVADLASKPTLGFVVDDTGSMHKEIESVQKLIRSFIKTERSEPQAYILTTFNDPGKRNPI